MILQVYEVVAQDGFLLLATMNPGGDYGKKEVNNILTVVFLLSLHSIIFFPIISYMYILSLLAISPVSLYLSILHF